MYWILIIMNSQSFLFYFTGVIWNKSHILTVKIILDYANFLLKNKH